MSGDELPPPPIAAEVDLRDFQFMPLDVVRLRDSDLASLETAEACWAAVLLWCYSWHQVPAASIPDDDRVLSKQAGYGRVIAEWRRVRPGALRGWIKCSDGRLYHPVVVEKAIEAWRSKLEYAYDRECDRIRKANKKRLQDKQPQLPFPTFEEWDAVRNSAGSGPASDGTSGESAGSGDRSAGNEVNSAGNTPFGDGIPAENALKGQGQGQGDSKNPPYPPERGAAALTRIGKKPRELRDHSLTTWLAVCDVVDETGKTDGLTWDHARQKLGEQAHQAIERIGGYRVIFARDRFTTGDLKSRFREHYERQLETPPPAKAGSAA